MPELSENSTHISHPPPRVLICHVVTMRVFHAFCQIYFTFFIVKIHKMKKCFFGRWYITILYIFGESGNALKSRVSELSDNLINIQMQNIQNMHENV